jgi:hypothetical protein
MQSQQPQPQPTPPPQQPASAPRPVTPVVQIQAAQPGQEVGVADVLIGSIALIGAIIVAALLVGLITGGLFISYRKWRERRTPDSTDPQHTRLNLSAP